MIRRTTTGAPALPGLYRSSAARPCRPAPGRCAAAASRMPADAASRPRATSWTTAYPVRNAKIEGGKFYFVQDFEPSFYPVGSESVLAENTYRFGLYGITAGGWLSKKLEHDYGMQCDHFEFGSDFGRYYYVNSGHRSKVFFYARPVTTRRGFELGVLALDRFHRAKPEYEINMAGWPVKG